MIQLLIDPYKAIANEANEENRILLGEIQSINAKYARMRTLQIKLEMPTATRYI